MHHTTLEVLCAHSTLGPLLLTPFSLSLSPPLHSLHSLPSTHPPLQPQRQYASSAPQPLLHPSTPSLLPHPFPDCPVPPGRPMPPYRFNSPPPPQITAGRSWSVLDDLEGAYPLSLQSGCGGWPLGVGVLCYGARAAEGPARTVDRWLCRSRADEPEESEEGGGRVDVVHGGKGDDRGRRGEAG